MSSIIDELKAPILPRGKFWEALAELKSEDESGYQAFADAIFEPHPSAPGEYKHKPVALQEMLVRHTNIYFSHSRITDIRKRYTSKEEFEV